MLKKQERDRIMQERDDRAFLENPELWSAWPVCPLKRYRPGQTTGFPDSGILFAVEGFMATVFECNVFLIAGSSLQEMVDDPSIKRTVYESLDDLLGAGWRVD